MTNKEYFMQFMDEVFEADKKTIEQLAADKKYCEFEDDIEEILKKDFARLGCDTSVGEPTGIGMELWLGSQIEDSTIAYFEQKYRLIQ